MSFFTTGPAPNEAAVAVNVQDFLGTNKEHRPHPSSIRLTSVSQERWGEWSELPLSYSVSLRMCAPEVGSETFPPEYCLRTHVSS